MSERTLNLIQTHDIRWVDLRFTDTKGKEQHVSIPAGVVDEDFFADGKMFDGSSISGWKGINESDMILMPDDSTAILDPFTDDPTVIVRCDIVEPATMQGYDRDPRSIAKKAEAYLAKTGVGDTAFPAVWRTGPHSFVMANYTSPLDEPDVSWLEGQSSRRGTQIYLMDIEFVAQ